MTAPSGKFINPTTAPFVDAALLQITKVYDGDTVHGVRAFDSVFTDWTVTTTMDRFPVRFRLVVVDTPELHAKGGEGARLDTCLWLHGHAGRLRVRTYGADDFGRLLADIYDERTSESLSSYLIQKGYPPFTPKH
jgi:endonuclease YncB( thermonuclease family)